VTAAHAWDVHRRAAEFLTPVQLRAKHVRMACRDRRHTTKVAHQTDDAFVDVTWRVPQQVAVPRLHDEGAVPDGESRLPSQTVHATAVVDVYGTVRRRSEFRQCRPRSVRRQIAALLNGHHL
jgi:hypothetical protein